MEFKSNNKDEKFDVDLFNEYEYIEMNFGLKQRFIDYINIDCYVEWSLALECRSWGVKDISPYATKIGVCLNIELEREEMIDQLTKELDVSLDPKIFNDKTFEYDFELDLSDFEISTQREGNDFHGYTKTQMSVESVQIDFEDKTIIVNL